ncbi:CAP domain-containing protein [Sporichthya polymorpha]|uniref:CAP domain-containing protein n=1 Tax=Sporichthya polymorpha TaxID=35751 RepID=UPI00037E354D|nr:CAP domain-containing protein [Sporichthya polymorpha]
MRARAPRLLAAFALTFSLFGGTLGATVVTAEPAEARSMSIKEQRRAIVKKTNKIRKAHGCRALKVRPKLNQAAQRHAKDMSRKRYFSHTSKDGTSWVTRIRRTGWRQPGGENIARGYYSASSVMSAWMHSPGHRRNIVNCQFRNIGVGYVKSGNYWVQDFGY